MIRLSLLNRKNETPFHYALRAPSATRVAIFETLLQHYKEPNLQLFLLNEVHYYTHAHLVFFELSNKFETFEQEELKFDTVVIDDFFF